MDPSGTRGQTLRLSALWGGFTLFVSLICAAVLLPHVFSVVFCQISNAFAQSFDG